MVLVIGVDGCRSGWLGALLAVGPDSRPRSVSFVCARRLADLWSLRPDVLAVDIPIGLPDGPEPRSADVAARARLRPRGSSVFPAPPRVVLGSPSYADACARARADTGRAVTLQTFNILAKVEDADRLATVAAPSVLVEVHPELSFAQMAGAPLATRKRTKDGRVERLQLLTEQIPGVDLSAVPAGDDAVDALAAAWSGLRWLNGGADVLGDGCSDSRGRPMRIVV